MGRQTRAVPLVWEEPNVSLDPANGGREPGPVQATPAADAPRPFRRLVSLTAVLRVLPKESIPMAETTVRPRVRHITRSSESERKNAAAALQRALDRRDNGGETGH
ncbi:hypothetical protein GCM10010521_39780 [Streptomyces rameus]|uniref:Uncharacterized protein n=1 Tax=Streptomyces rameus TaxID=68261 RepID=A0ABP6NJM6_9ACTN